MNLHKQKIRKVISALGLTIRIGLGCLFIYGSIAKIMQPYGFLMDIYKYELVRPELGLLTAIVLPYIELITGICLVGEVFVSGALLACMGMAVVFSFVLSWALYQQLDISCGCFGPPGGKIGYLTVIRALAVFAMAAFSYFVDLFLLPELVVDHDK